MFVLDDTLVCLTEKAALPPTAALSGFDAGLNLLQGSATRSLSADSITDRTPSNNEVSPRTPHAGSYTSGTDAEASEAAVTTLMIRNLPRRFFVEDLMNELKRFVREDSYDFVHVPMDPKDDANIGYAFVNFKHPADAAAVSKGLAGQMWTMVESSRRAKVAKASVQGFWANLKHCSERIDADADERHFPAVFHEGKTIGFRSAERLLLRKGGGGRMETAAAADTLSEPPAREIGDLQQWGQRMQRQQPSQYRPQSPAQAMPAPMSTWAPRPVVPQQRQQQKRKLMNLKIQSHQALPRASKAATVPTMMSDMTVAPPPGLEGVVRTHFQARQTAAGGFDTCGKEFIVAPSAAAYTDNNREAFTGVLGGGRGCGSTSASVCSSGSTVTTTATGAAASLISPQQSEQFNGFRTNFMDSSAFAAGNITSKMDGCHGFTVAESPMLEPEQSKFKSFRGANSCSVPTLKSCGFKATSSQATVEWEVESAPSSISATSVQNIKQSAAFRRSSKQMESQLLQLLSMQPRASSF